MKTHPEFEARIAAVKRLTILPLQITMYELGAGNVPELRDDWSMAAQQQLRTSLDSKFKEASNLRLTWLEEDAIAESEQDNYAETQVLYDVVLASVARHTLRQNAMYFQHKAESFVYSLGEEVRALDPDADAFLIVNGFDERSTGARKALQGAGVLLGAVIGIVPIPQSGRNALIASCVDASTGELLWTYHTVHPYDLREEQPADLFVQDLFRVVPSLGRP